MHAHSVNKHFDVLFGYNWPWACTAKGRWPTVIIHVTAVAYEDTWLGAKAIARSWAESPCTCAKFNEIPETTDTHKPVEMRCKISCLALRRSAISDKY